MSDTGGWGETGALMGTLNDTGRGGEGEGDSAPITLINEPASLLYLLHIQRRQP